MSVTLTVGDVIQVNVRLLKQLIDTAEDRVTMRVVDIVDHDGVQSLVLGLHEKDI